MLDTANPEMHLAPKKCLAYVLFLKNFIHFFFFFLYYIYHSGYIRKNVRKIKSVKKLK